MNKIDKRLHFLLGKVKEECTKVKELSDYELKNKTLEFKERLKNGETTDDLLPEAFAVCCEADYRVLGMFPYDVQILGGIALHLCYLCEMNTGEGKTLTATMPMYLNGLTGKSSILVTANEYLAIRDAEEMGQVYKFLGLSVEAGVKRDTNEKLDNDSKKDVYNADIVYTTHGALGFDYLLNNLVQSKEDRFMRDFYYVIIDEADSVLLDSASMPLVISGSPRVQSNLYGITDFFVTTLVEDEHYIVETNDGYCWFDCSIYGGREFTGIDAVKWAIECEERGAGEILLTSMDRDGTKIGYDLELTKTISENVSIPVIASGGVGNPEHIYDSFSKGKADAALAASIFHFDEYPIPQVKNYLKDKNIPIRI